MGKIIVRILVVLLVAGAVAGGIYLWGNSSVTMSTRALEGRPGGHEFTGDMPQMTAPGDNLLSAAPASRPQPGSGEFVRGGHGAHSEFNLGAGLAGVGKNLAIIALITLGVILVQQCIRQVTRRRNRKAAV